VRADGTRTNSELRKAISEHFWWHDMELRPGITTPGHANVQAMLPYYGIPEDLTGQSVLDIGCWDGFYSFECERRGAERVVSSDLWEPAGRGAFDLAREELGSYVVPLESDVYDLNPRYDPDKTPRFIGQFDLVLFLGVLYHLKHPMLALEKVAACTKPGGLTIIDTVVMNRPEPSMMFISGSELGDDPTNWWVPSQLAMILMLREAGYATVTNTVPLYCGNRGVFHAVKASDEDVSAQAERRLRERRKYQYPPYREA
jgi:tRNA (mo5U34)-methyltransferase